MKEEPLTIYGNLSGDYTPQKKKVITIMEQMSEMKDIPISSMGFPEEALPVNRD